MTLSRINLPSISSVLTSNRVFLPGHSVVTELDMEASQLIPLPIPDHLMKTIHLNEEAPFRDQASSENEPKPDIVIGEDESAATTSESPSAPRGTAPKSSTPPKSLKHDSGPLASSLRILSPIKVVRSFSRSGSKTRAFSTS